MALADWLDPAGLAASADHLADADDALDWAAVREWDEQVGRSAEGLAYRPNAPRAVRLRVLERILAELGREGTPRGSEIARLDTALSQGKTATLAGVRGAARPEAAGRAATPVPWRRRRRRSLPGAGCRLRRGGR